MTKKFVTNFLILVLLALALVLMVLPLFGYRSYVVVSDSMHPTIPKYSLVYIKVLSEQEKQELLPGDIVAVKTEGIPLMHRIQDINGNQVQTKGDANEDPDAWVSIDRIIGVKVFFIPLLGLLYYSIYPWLILIASVLIYLLTRQLVKEFKKK
jgi:signal peptidase